MSRRWLQKRMLTPAECRRRLGLSRPEGAADENAASRASAWLGRTVIGWFDHPALWHVNRRSIAGAVAIGLFVGWLPLPGQMLIAALVAAGLRVHVPLSVVMVWFTNPLTVAPLGYVAWRAGSMILGTRPPSESSGASLSALLAQLDQAWPVLLTGSLFCAALSAVLGFALTLVAWRVAAIRRWRSRPAALRGARR